MKGNEMVRMRYLATKAIAVLSAIVLAFSLTPGLALGQEDSSSNASQGAASGEASAAAETPAVEGDSAGASSGAADAAASDENSSNELAAAELEALLESDEAGTKVSAQETGDEASSASAASTGSTASTGSSSTGSSSNASTTTTHKPPVAGPNTISWANTSADASQWFGDELAVLPNGTADVVSVTLPSSDGGTTLTKAELATKTTSDSAYFSKGVLCAPEGSKVTMTILPARGYQLLAKTICDGAISLIAVDDDEKIGQYTFDMPADGLALDCGFSAANDVVVIDEVKDITSGSISSADAAVQNGTLELDLQAIDDAEEKKKFDAKVPSGNSVIGYYDAVLSNTVNQGSTEDTWDTVLEETANPITITLALSDSAIGGATQFYVIRESSGQYQQAAVNYDAATKSISFQTNKFSSYALVRGAPAQSSEPATTPKTGDAERTIPLVFTSLLSACVAVYAFRRLRSLRVS